MSDSSDDRRRAGMSPDDGADPFAPATVDEAIEAARLSSLTDGDDDREAALVRALFQIHALPPGATATLERVRNQLQSAARADDDDPPMPGDLPQVVRTLPPWRPFRARFGGWQTSFAREIAAVLVVALLGASFFAALHHGGTIVRNGQPTPGVAHPIGPIGVWQDASISQASTDGKLDFDPTVGVTYAANRDTGDVYACGSGHLWWSHDGGVTYTPFMPALPAQAAPTHSARCVITTIPGFPGVFATSDAALQGGNPIHGAGPIFYAQSGDAGWQTLAIPSTARVINSTPTTALHADDIWADIFTDFASGNGEPAVGSHNWLFARIRSSYTTSIVATPDFGHTWVWLDGPSAAFSCGNYAVDPADPRTVVCDHGNASALSETNNSGYTWQRRDAQPLPDSAVAGVHSEMLYGEQGVNGATHILRRSLATDTWQDVGGAGAAGATAQVTLSPTGTLYVLLVGGGATGRNFTFEALAPDAAHIDMLLTAPLPGHSQNNVRLVGLGPGGVPALYAYDVPLRGSSLGPSLARLLLPSSGIQSGGATPAPTQAARCPNPPPAGVLAGDLADLQPGGLGAPLATFPGRWGPSDGVAAGTTFFGKNSDGVNTVGVQADPATQRAVSLAFTVDTNQPMTLEQAKAFVRTVIPTDASDLSLGAPPQGNPWRLGYCSPALASVFAGQNANNTFGRLEAAYYQNAHDVYRITIMPIISG